MVDVYRFLKIF